jgi:hypothetical protein
VEMMARIAATVCCRIYHLHSKIVLGVRRGTVVMRAWTGQTFGFGVHRCFFASAI